MADPDELARTATAVAGTSEGTAPEIGGMLGRYRLERMLGEGGMGVVHAAFDPDLERRVALKVLRKIDASGDARQRLLREARAMARLTHENVVVVHEVGTAGDRDYVAMELIDGETLADWLAEPREVPEVVDAFCAAGRGLAAAHAAGLVHRDFKPHNVLRRRDGKIVVTDFGLARGVEDSPGVALETTVDLGKGSSQPSGLSGITKTGAVLGTPAYMAPEQWTGGTVGPAADQFAFCVALWEALTGSRPFKGGSIEELKAEVKRGPAQLDASKLPRRLRRTLVRGLDPDSKKRWPSMDALLAAIRRADRHVGLAFMFAGGALVAGGIALAALHHSGPTCDSPVIDPTSVWQEAFGKNMAPELSELFNAQITHWAVARATACTADPLAKQVQLHCLDGVLERLDVVRQAFGSVAKVTTDDTTAELVDPSICLGPAPPRLGFPHTPDAIAAYTLYAQSTIDPKKQHAAEALVLANRPNLDACSRAVALVTGMGSIHDFQTRRSTANDAVAASEQCDDDRLRADILLVAAPLQFEDPMIGPHGMEAIKRADSAIARVPEPQLKARLALMRAEVATQQGHGKEALDLADHAVEFYESNNQIRYAIRAALTSIGLRFSVGGKERRGIQAIVARWLPVAKSLHVDESVTSLERVDAIVRYFDGDPTAHADIVKLWRPPPDHKPPHPLEGDVVDRDGKPVVGATVAVASDLISDSVGIGIPMYRNDEEALHVTTTDDAGHWKLPDAPSTGAMMAQLGDRRSVATTIVDQAKLVVLPTRRLAGKVALGTTPNSDCIVVVQDPNDKSTFSQIIAPVAPDGSFVIDGVPQNGVKLGIGVAHPNSPQQLSFKDVPASKEPVTGLVLNVPSSQRTLDVLARSTYSQPLDAAQVLILPGKVQLATVGELLDKNPAGELVRFAHHLSGESLPKDAAALYRNGDLIAQFNDVPDGEVTACVLGLPADMQDEALMAKIRKHRGELELRCVTIEDDAKAIVISAPPPKNMD